MRIENMIPFLNSKDLGELAQSILKGELDINLTTLLPFMDEADVDKICLQLSENPQLMNKVNMSALYPFASEEYVDKIFLAGVRNGKMENSALPFVSDKCLHKLVEEYVQNDSVNFEIDKLYPFLDDEDVTLLFKTYIEKHKKTPTEKQQ